jgi:O-antigen/teichoic acid export membrane protein
MKNKVKNILQLFLEKGGINFIMFIIVFGLVKGNTFLSPLLLANTIAIEEYGTIEFALSIGMIFAAFAHLGIGTSYPFFNLKQNRKDNNSIILFHGILISLVGVFCGLLIINLSFFEFKYGLGIQILFVFASQLILSIIYRTNKKSITAIIIDGSLYIPFLLYGVLLLLLHKFDITILHYFYILYQLVLLIIYLFKWKVAEGEISSKAYLEVISFGGVIVVCGVFGFSLTMGGRLMVEHFFSEAETGYYSFYYRFATVVMLIYQAMTIYFFKDLYVKNLSKLDKFFAIFIAVIMVVGITFWSTVPLVLIDYVPLLKESINEYKSLYLLLCFQMPFWISMALNENIIYRENLSKWFSIVLGITIVFMTSILFLIDYLIGVTLPLIVLVNILAYYIVIEGQFFLIKQKTEVKFAKTRYVLWGIMILGSFLFFVVK